MTWQHKDLGHMHPQYCCSKYLCIRIIEKMTNEICHYVKLTKLLLFEINFQKVHQHADGKWFSYFRSANIISLYIIANNHSRIIQICTSYLYHDKMQSCNRAIFVHKSLIRMMWDIFVRWKPVLFSFLSLSPVMQYWQFWYALFPWFFRLCGFYFKLLFDCLLSCIVLVINQELWIAVT